MAAASAQPVELGFAEVAPAWRLRSEHFPSKVGGRPAWLGGAGLPGPEALGCARCGRPLAFLLQVYAPLPERPDAFHRGLFLFCCREPPCCAGLRVFRNQLPRKNEFYSYDPPPENSSSETESVCLQLKSGAHLCRVCGCLGPKACSRCQNTYYCSKEHQTLDWRLGHKQLCTKPDHLNHTVPDHNFLFPEFEIVTETENEILPEAVEKEDDYEVIGSMDEGLEEELDFMAKHESREEYIFQKFKTQIALEPQQILRYGRGIKPLWISGENIPQEKDIPDCRCGSKRIFEFQVQVMLGNTRLHLTCSLHKVVVHDGVELLNDAPVWGSAMLPQVTSCPCSIIK
uniref:programmed cell death protein 2 isoform X2 n=1 Tax=Jaculus jaculus TaxID=51337 RepID=UPI001E1B4A23|nr:programmed cell death protein 2 isoform X2 [Jaculus jaculus]